MQLTKWADHIKRISVLSLYCLPFAAVAQTTTNVLPLSPQFGIYASSPPTNYTPPSGVIVLLGSQKWYTLTKLSAAQQQQLGSDLRAEVNYSAGCDSYDRIESVVYLTKSPGVQPTTADLPNAVEMARFMSTFNYYDQTAPTYVYPLMDVSTFAPFLTSTTQDIWVGIAGGSNPTFPPSQGYQLCWNSSNQPSTTIPLTTFPSNITEAQAPYVGFSFGLSFTSSQPAATAAAGTAIVAALSAPTVPSGSSTTLSIAGTLTVPTQPNNAATVTGTVAVIVTSHGSDSEYGFNTGNTLAINGAQVGSSFSTQADCDAYANTTINPLNTGVESNSSGSNPSNPRNWCPGAPVRTTAANLGTPNPTSTNPGTPVQVQIFNNVTLNVGSNTVALDMGAFTTTFGGAYNASNGDYYPTSITFLPGASTGSGTPGTYNVYAIYTDKSSFSTGGIDGNGYAYSSNLLGSSLSWNSSTLSFGPANSEDAWSSTTITLPSGQYSTLNLLATGVNGNQASQTFTVNYTDGTDTVITQSLSDWFTPQSYSGESKAATLAYRDTSSGTEQSGTQYLYGYSFAINNSKTVKSITLPNNRNVVVLAYALSNTSTSVATPVSLSSSFNRIGIYTDGTAFSSSGGLDGAGYAYSSQLLGASLTYANVPFKFGTANAANDISAAGQTITLPAGKFSSLQMLATAVNGNQASQVFTVTYTDRTTSSYTQSLSDWYSPQSYTGESDAVKMTYRDTSSGGKDSRTFYLYDYAFSLNNAKTVQSVQLPSNANVQVIALTLMP
jgi:hypothetical protein